MQIYQATARLTSPSQSSEKVQNTPIISTSEKAEKTVETTDLKPYNKILENYDMSNISPKEIDELYKELVTAGHPLNKDMFQLSTRGAMWRQHLAEIGAKATNTEVTFDPDKKINLFDEIRGNIEFNRQNGFDTTHYENLLKFVAKLDGAILTDGTPIVV